MAPPQPRPAAEGSRRPGGHPPSPLHRHGDRRLYPLPRRRHGQAGGALSGASRGAAGRVQPFPLQRPGPSDHRPAGEAGPEPHRLCPAVRHQ